jgi:molecular chaperone GrpE
MPSAKSCWRDNILRIAIMSKEKEEIKVEDSVAGDAPAAETQETAAAAGEAAETSAAPDWKGMYARALADFDNFRKRTARDREDLVKFAASDVLKALLPTVDDLARALAESGDKADDPFVAGVKLVYDGLVKMLADQGATPLDACGEPFDANYHEALATLPSADVAEGIVTTEVKRGWLLHGKLLRAAQVVVSSGAPN